MCDALETKMKGAHDTRFDKFLKRIAGDRIYTSSLQNREKWLRDQLMSVPRNGRILDAGAGEGQYKHYCDHLHYVSQDFGGYDGEGDGAGLQTGSWDNTHLDIISDIALIPEPDESFDAIMCIEVLEHVPSPIDAIREFSRLLRPEGQLILTAPFASLTHFAPFHFYSGFNRYFYKEWLPKFGFEIIDMVPNGNYFDYLRLELGRIRSVVREHISRRNRLGLIEYLAIWVLLRSLRRYSRSDTSSHELLCYGYHLRAVKRR